MIKYFLVTISAVFAVAVEATEVSCANGKYNFPLANSNIRKVETDVVDKNGVPMLRLDNGEVVYYPIQIAQAAVIYYKNYKQEGLDESRQKFLMLSKWLLASFVDNGGWGGWLTESQLPGSDYNLKQNWISSMSQGFAISAMLAAYDVTGDDAYMQTARKAVRAFAVSSVAGGLRNSFGRTVWYDEYPTHPQKHVLNGFVFALAGLYDYYCSTSDRSSLTFLRAGLDALAEHISSFDAGWGSYYSQSEKNSTKHGIATVTGDRYQALHVAQLLWAHAITGREIFFDYANRFLQQDFGEATINYGIDKKFSEISASHSIKPESHGPENLDDGIISYGLYWSSNRFPATVTIEMNRRVQGMREFTLVSTGERLADFEVFAQTPNDEVRLDFLLVYESRLKERHFDSLVQTYRFREDMDETPRGRIVVASIAL